VQFALEAQSMARRKLDRPRLGVACRNQVAPSLVRNTSVRPAPMLPTARQRIAVTQLTPLSSWLAPPSAGVATRLQVEPFVVRSTSAVELPTPVDVEPTAVQLVAEVQLTSEIALSPGLGAALRVQVIPFVVRRMSVLETSPAVKKEPTATHVVAVTQLTSVSSVYSGPGLGAPTRTQGFAAPAAAGHARVTNDVAATTPSHTTRGSPPPMTPSLPWLSVSSVLLLGATAGGRSGSTHDGAASPSPRCSPTSPATST
jgi:hypothetical protein